MIRAILAKSEVVIKVKFPIFNHLSIEFSPKLITIGINIKNHDKINIDFHDKVIRGYKIISKNNKRFYTIDATKSINSINEKIIKEIIKLND